MTAHGYIGRFAPSPTGPLHFGSLLAAVASYLEAKSNDGRWLLRIEDIDPPREVDGAANSIIETLDAYGFEWDGPTIFQSKSADAHNEAIDRLGKIGLTYECSCSRADLRNAPEGELGKIYPGTCRTRTPRGNTATRVYVEGTTQFTDRIQGKQSMDLERESGDFVIRRKDGLAAYHLAVVVDDILQEVTHIVRGTDLMPSTHRQIYLQQCLNAQSPIYAHIPVAVHSDGDKLSKLTGATALSTDRVEATLLLALQVLRQAPPQDLIDVSIEQIWQWAIAHWDIDALQGITTIEVSGQKG